MHDTNSNGCKTEMNCLQEINNQFHLLQVGDRIMNQALERTRGGTEYSAG